MPGGFADTEKEKSKGRHEGIEKKEDGRLRSLHMRVGRARNHLPTERKGQ